MINQRSSREPIICVLCSIERHLKKIKRKAIQAGYQNNTMIVSGVKSLLNICKYNHNSEGHIYFTIMLITNILPKRNSFYKLVAEITNNFVEYRELGYALIDMLVLLSNYRDELHYHIIIQSIIISKEYLQSLKKFI